MTNKYILNFSNHIDKNVDAFFLLNPDNISRENNFKKIDLKPEEIVIPEQIHSNKIEWVDTPGEYCDVDGIITSNAQIILSLKVADCVPIYLFDPRKKIFALIHSGWRGTKGKIANKGINMMLDHGSNVQEIKCYLGPCIGQCCYEVENDVSKYFNDSSKIKINSKKSKLDLKIAITEQLESVGILSENIKKSDICTFESTVCHSFRRDGELAGRMYSLMKLKS
tara:strand:- start:600 stop:1271 length:672 start_codon:yes stop_codon:yes gene_type:complete